MTFADQVDPFEDYEKFFAAGGVGPSGTTFQDVTQLEVGEEVSNRETEQSAYKFLCLVEMSTEK